ncbi:hypothetical protein EHI8A_102850 [Entamoeba histolytica HM-1:IMSS-B]|uniref:CNH domain-containing protein n=5 Tax=Entamoeba histolytica TaxID=5759 RepID=C4M7B7_ENTH1|nr:hypothetical protein EHI_055970 [Entamoeba histolytica HM-1:IMSS]EMD45324.1 Hypothetical protein EHI5A_122690 [Entamoeba histolytica KU27]EMH72796.1 hypothetical protein EHI8A_102850 [Entamoeba histolytica HM-1:IMSS-B]ENY64693.1 hypothetical protein EHI7A_084270 [Entamoeba histolytica HM-1:IMSS-A]GAT97417.1 hypothetical protein CL6EHI_055970 [Entamoeba histolytica]EAL43736.1 hypothetical protein EHI_055970 [Entamoeba histolytica HM-1:IMSS]|eukprot:XP_649117.1 hypothetical protein EHI_055970 [Entamoeba histolytica HM-1:IMSS]
MSTNRRNGNKTTPYLSSIILNTVPTQIRSICFIDNQLFIGGEDGTIYKAEYIENKYMIMKGVRVSKQPITCIQAFPRNGLLLFVTTLRIGALTTTLEKLKVNGMDIIGSDCAVILKDKSVIKSRVDKFGIYSTQRTLTFIEYSIENGFERKINGIVFDMVPQTIEWVGDRLYYIQGDLIKFVRLSDRKVGVLRVRRGEGKMRPFVRAVGEYVLIGNAESLQIIEKKGTPVEKVKEVFPTMLSSLFNIVVIFPFVLCFYPDCIRIYNFFTGQLDDTIRIKSSIVNQNERDVVVCLKQTNGPIQLLKAIDLIQFINEYIKVEQYNVISQLLDSYTNEMQTALPVLSDEDLLLVRVVYGGVLLENYRYNEAFEQFIKCSIIKTESKVSWDVRTVIAIFDNLIEPNDKFKQYSPVDWKLIENKIEESKRIKERKLVYSQLSEFLQRIQKITKYDKELETQRIKAMIVAERSDVVEEIERDERRGWFIDVDNVLKFVKNGNDIRVLSKLNVMKKDYISALRIWNKLAMGNDQRVFDYGIEDVLNIIQLLDCSNRVELRLLKIVLNWLIPEVFNECLYFKGEFPSILLERCKTFEERLIKEQFTQIFLKKLNETNHQQLLDYINLLHAKLYIIKTGLSNKFIGECKECISIFINGSIEVINNSNYRKEFQDEMSHTLQHLLQNSKAVEMKTIINSLQKYHMQKELIVVYERMNQVADLIDELMKMGGISTVLHYCQKHPIHSKVLFDYSISKNLEVLPIVIETLIEHLDINHVLEQCIEYKIDKQIYLPFILKRIRELANTYLALQFQYSTIVADSIKEPTRYIMINQRSVCYLCNKHIFNDFVLYQNHTFCSKCYSKMKIPQKFIF